MSYKEEIESLEERLAIYLKGLGGHPERDTLLSKKIKNMEKQLDILKKAEAFDKVLNSYDTAPSYDEIGEEVIDIVNKFRGSEW